MPSFRRRASVIDADRVDEPTQDPDRVADAADALALAEEAEAEAVEAEALAHHRMDAPVQLVLAVPAVGRRTIGEVLCACHAQTEARPADRCDETAQEAREGNP